MNDDFANGIADRLQQCMQENSLGSSQNDTSAPLAPLHVRLKNLLNDIPPSVQNNGLSLLALQARLRGRKGGLPHIGELGAAMRRLGWQRRREWSDEESAFASKWFPAEEAQMPHGD